MSVYDSVLKGHGGTEAVGGEKLGIFLSFGGTLSKSLKQALGHHTAVTCPFGVPRGSPWP